MTVKFTILGVRFTAWEEGKVDLGTSELTLVEIKRHQDACMRAAIEEIFRRLEKVEIVRWDELVSMRSYGDTRTWINTGLIENYPEYGELLKLKLEQTDAQHVYVAGKQACDTFLTCDKGILATRRRDQRHFFVADGSEAFAVGCEG